MKLDITLAAVGLSLVALVSGCCTTPSRPLPKHVVLFGCDGLGGVYLDGRAKTPNLDRLKQDGAWTLKSHSILPSSSACNWASMFMCAGPETHGYVDWNTREPVFPLPFALKSGRFPDVFALLRAERPDAEIGYFYQWDGLGFLVDTNAAGRIGANLSQTGEEAVAYLKEKKPDLLAILYDHPDHEGHSKGFGGAEYVAEIERLDGVLGNVLAAIEEAGIADETVVIVTSDHGGEGKGHGKPNPACMYRPLFLAGKGIRKGHELTSSTAVYDVGATMLWLLGLDEPQACTGRPILEAFEQP